MGDEGIVKRLKVIVKDHGGQLALAGEIGVDQGFISKVINKKQEMSYYLIRKLCFQLKYSPEWLILGTGEKKINKPESAKLITEIQMMRTELDILHARMRAFELEIKELKDKLDLKEDLIRKLEAEGLKIEKEHKSFEMELTTKLNEKLHKIETKESDIINFLKEFQNICWIAID